MTNPIEAKEPSSTLTVFKQKPNKDWIEHLENALARAKSGEVTGGAVIESTMDTIRTSRTGLKNKFEFVGLLQNAVQIILNE
jgi:hypothetical protein